MLSTPAKHQTISLHKALFSWLKGGEGVGLRGFGIILLFKLNSNK